MPPNRSKGGRLLEEATMRLEGRHLVIIGGSSGIGLETARLALAEGAFVTIAGRSEERLRRAAETLGNSRAVGTAGGRVRLVVADVTDESSVRALFEGEPRVDHLFLPAGELQPGGDDVLGADLNGLRSILESRLVGAAYVVRQARPRMVGGSITLMSGLYSTRPARGGAFGAAAVAAVEGMTRALALDLAPTRVNAVAPGLIDTPLWDALGTQREAILAMGTGLPVGRIGRPQEVAEGVVFLMCNGFVTGTVLSIDGGGSLV
jgi:NAD(P)-dependent dehydrogenase (short-subunit alcohol dehydrogenase family)